MADTDIVQSGETPESPDGTAFTHHLSAPTVGAQMAELLHLRGEMVELRRMVEEIHMMSREGYELMQSPGVKAMQRFTGRKPLLGGGRG